MFRRIDKYLSKVGYTQVVNCWTFDKPMTFFVHMPSGSFALDGFC